jgi:hypothetical protein
VAFRTTIAAPPNAAIRQTQSARSIDAEGMRSLCELGNDVAQKDNRPVRLKDCWADWQTNFRIGLGGDDVSPFELAAGVALAILLAGWLFRGLVYLCVVWVRRGFRAATRL